ncbi:MAG TPA: CARDB domain-containing protein, partial [Phycisphaerae bacterium]|nr:CARDB domain-containing protein [Phycisphaerae bacterium]
MTKDDGVWQGLLLVGTLPGISGVQASYDGDSRGDYVGRFVSGIDLNNTFTASVSDADGDLDRVSFALSGITLTDDSSSGGWTATFNMGDLSAGTHTLQVVAADQAGNTSQTYTQKISVVDFPSWLGSPDVDDHFSGGTYYLNGFVPEQLDISHTIDPNWWIIGGEESRFRLGAELSLKAGLNPAYDVPIYHEFVLEAKVLGQDLFGFSGDPFTFEIGGGTASFSGLADGEDLSLAGFSANLTSSFRVSDFLSDLKDLGLIHGNPLSITGPSYTTIVPIGIVPVPVTVSTGIDFDLAINASLSMGLSSGQIKILPGTYLEPVVTAEPYLFGGIGIPGLNAGLEVGGELGLHYRGEYNSVDGFEDYLYGSFQLNFRAVATAGRKYTLATWTVPDGGPWTFGNVPQSTGMTALALTGEGNPPDITAWPNVTADDAGNVLLTRVVDLDPDPGEIDPEIFYAMRDAGGNWSALNPVATNGLIENDPQGVFDGLGGAVAVWVANTIDPLLVESTDYDSYLSQQEVHSSYWNGTSWSTPQSVTSDDEMDGGPTVAFHNGQGLMLWEHAGGTGSTDLDGFDIRYAVWDNVAHAWGGALSLTSDDEGDWAPTVAFGPGGEAMAVWVHDADTDPTTAELYYATWDGVSWSAASSIPLVATGGVREPCLRFTSAGDAILAWIGNEGGADILYTSVRDPVSGTWSVPEVVSGTPSFIEGLRLDVSATDQAILVWHGWDGENDLFSTTRNLAEGGVWTQPRRITSGSGSEWLASVAFDSTNVPITVWADENATTVFGDGVDGIQLELLPNLETSAEQIAFDDEQPDEGQTVCVSATITNTGWVASEAATVRFYLGDPGAGGIQIDGDVSLGSLEPGASCVLSTDFAASSHENAIYVVVDADETVDELSEADNTATASAFVLPDLEVLSADISVSDDNPLTGDVIDITATVRNVGGVGA